MRIEVTVSLPDLRWEVKKESEDLYKASTSQFYLDDVEADSRVGLAKAALKQISDHIVELINDGDILSFFAANETLVTVAADDGLVMLASDLVNRGSNE
jgi:hypothetical protein